jgi:hypothetical protein
LQSFPKGSLGQRWFEGYTWLKLSAPISMMLARDTQSLAARWKLEPMVSLRLAVPAVLFAAASAGCFTYFVPAPAQVTASPQLPEKMPESRTGNPANINPPKVQERADDFLQAAQAILKQEPNALASVDKPAVTGHVHLPKKRPLPR